ncbi:MAG TPA: hypothetical protein VJ998_02665, partial [Pseudomonadales bacterium]|nr:hypothetical protein [Pseudomonadales bacterium]
GGLVNPVPISLCHALGANFIVAVNLNGDLVNRYLDQRVDPPVATADVATAEESEPPDEASLMGRISHLTRTYTGGLFQTQDESDSPRVPSLISSIASAINITQDRITRSRMAGDPPDILLSPQLAHIGLLELYRAEEAIEEGRNCVRRMMWEIERIAARKERGAE